MTTDSEAWVRLMTEMLAPSDSTPEEAAEWSARFADRGLALYRERQKRGDFGASPEPEVPIFDRQEAAEEMREEMRHLRHDRDLIDGEAEFLTKQLDECERTRDTAMRERDEALSERDNLQDLLNRERVKAEQATARADSAFRERGEAYSALIACAKRDEQRARAEAEEVEARLEQENYRREKVHADELQRLLAEQRARAEVAEAALAQAQADEKTECDARRLAESLLKEALRALRQWKVSTEWYPGAERVLSQQPPASSYWAGEAVLSKARASGYVPEGETP